MKKLYAIFVCLLFIGTILAAANIIAAPKPENPGGGKPGGGEEIPPGTVYFSYNDGTGSAVWTMAADGADKSKLAVEPSLDHWYDEHFYTFGEISRIKHNGHYWFLRFSVIKDEYGDPELYPDGLPRKEAFAVRDDNTISVQLTNDPTLAPNHRSLGPYWGPEDEFISWGAKKWVYDGSEWSLDDTQAGVFTAEINFDSNGDIDGADPPELIWWTELRLNIDNYWHPRTGHNHDWSPDGTAFCWQRGGIQVVDFVAENETHIASGYTPRWSPDGNKICFLNSGICTIDPDGSNEQLIVDAENSRNTWIYTENPRWSPDSQHISYYYREYNYWKNTNKHWICRIETGGGKPVKMTNDLSSEAFKDNIDWR